MSNFTVILKDPFKGDKIHELDTHPALVQEVDLVCQCFVCKRHFRKIFTRTDRAGAHDDGPRRVFELKGIIDCQGIYWDLAHLREVVEGE